MRDVPVSKLLSQHFEGCNFFWFLFSQSNFRIWYTISALPVKYYISIDMLCPHATYLSNNRLAHALKTTPIYLYICFYLNIDFSQGRRPEKRFVLLLLCVCVCVLFNLETITRCRPSGIYLKFIKRVYSELINKCLRLLQ